MRGKITRGEIHSPPVQHNDTFFPISVENAALVCMQWCEIDYF